MEIKTCPKCKETKPADHWYPSERRLCKACCKERNRRYSQSDKGKLAKKNNRRRQYNRWVERYGDDPEFRKNEAARKADYYRRNGEAIRKRNQRNHQAARAKFKEWLLNEVGCTQCTICGEKEPCCLEFHHHAGDKVDSISGLIASRVSKEEILAEAKKCVVLCSNCHKKEHKRLKTEAYVG